MKGISTLEENRNRTIESLDRFIEMETGKKPSTVGSSQEFFYDAIRASRLELATEFPGEFREANEEVDKFLSQTLVLFMDDKYTHNAKLVSKYLTDHMLNQQEGKPSAVMLYINYRISGEWVTFYYGFFGNPRNTSNRNTARQKGSKMLSLMGPAAPEEEGKAKLMEEKDFIRNGEYFFEKAAEIATEIPYRHPDNEVIRELSHTLCRVAPILQRARINCCSGNSKITDSDLDNLAGNIELR